MDVETEHSVVVTHFINPHLFWFCHVGLPGNENTRVLADLERRLQDFYQNKLPVEKQVRLTVGDKVAVNFLPWKKVIRAKLLETEQENYIVWITDYGFPLLTKGEYIRRLPEEFQCYASQVHCGGVTNLQPAEVQYDHVESNVVLVKQDQWLEKACEILRNILADSSQILFFEKFNSKDNHRWGDLIIINYKGQRINASICLQKAKYAMEVGPEFPQICLRYKTTNIAPWLNNDHKPNMRYNSFKNITDHSKKTKPVIIDEDAKRKVADWCARNKRLQEGNILDMSLEAPSESLDDQSIDDIRFSDSVSVIKKSSHSRRHGNENETKRMEHFEKEPNSYTAKNGTLRKLNAKYYASKVFDLKPNDAFQETTFKIGMPPKHTATSASSNTSSTNAPSRLLKLAEFRAKSARNNTNLQQRIVPLTDTKTNVSPVIESEGNSGSNSVRLRYITQIRKKCAKRLPDSRKKNSISDSTTSVDTISTNQSVMLSYEQLDQEIKCAIEKDSNLDKSQTSNSEISLARVQHLNALRFKIRRQSETSVQCDPICNATTDSTLTMTRSKYMENLRKAKEQLSQGEEHADTIENFRLEPKIVSQSETQSCSNDTTALQQMTTSKDEEREEKQAAYDEIKMLPAGFDIARLQNYSDEKNHWHRKKTTRFDKVPHVISPCKETLLDANDHSSPSSSFRQINASEPKQNHSTSSLEKGSPHPLKKNQTIEHERNISDLPEPSVCEDSRVVQPTKCLSNDGVISGFAGSLPSHKLTSIPGSRTIQNKSRKHHELKSPNTQISKINEILKQHGLDSEPGNDNILDIKRFSISPQKPPKERESSDTTTSKNNTIVSNISVSEVNRNIGMNISESSDKFCNKKLLKNVSNYTTLMEVKHTDYMPIVEGEIKMQTKFIDHLVLAHSSIPLSPIENVAEASFLPEIHEEMRNMRINKVYRIQVYSWTHLLRGNSLFVVNPSRTGKTWSYLPALCSLVCYRSEKLKPSYGPVALVMVASSRHVESVNNYSRRLMRGFKPEAPTCVPSYGMRNFIDTKVQLLNGCGILITTPSSLLRLLNDNEKEPLFDWERLQFIVIDDMDLMLSRSHEDFQSAVRIVFTMSKKSKYKTLQPQMIVTSRDWDGVMIKLIRKSNQPLLLIGDFLEAAVYGRSSLSVKLKSREEKNETIHLFLRKQMQSLQGDLTYKRLLIMCNSDGDVERAFQFLTECGYPCVAFYNRSTDKDNTTLDEWKKKLSSQILICTDDRFSELQIQNVQNLIHYSLPTTWTQFTTRFSAMAHTYYNFVFEKFNDPGESSVASPPAQGEDLPYSMILLDEENSLQLPRLVDFMRKHNQDVHPDILAVSKRVLQVREETRILNGALLCPQLMEFGECDEARCNNRHELTPYDVKGENNDIPCQGDMRIHILKVFSPTHYTARMLQHKPPNSQNWIEVRRSKEALAFTMQLDFYYRNENNLSPHWPAKINDMCIYKYADNFRRARILDAPPLLTTNIVQPNLKVKLKLIDEGSTLCDIKCSEIYVCHAEFKDFPAQSVDVRLMHVVPFDNERTWDTKTTKQVERWIMDDIKPNHFVLVGVNFSLANTMWVKNVVVMEELATLGTYRQFVNLKNSLIQKNFAVVYNGERKHIRDIAEEYGLLKPSQVNKVEGEHQSCQSKRVDVSHVLSSSNKQHVSNMKTVKNDEAEGSNTTTENRELKAVKNDEAERSNTTMENQELKAVEKMEHSKSNHKSNINDEENWDNMPSDENEPRNEVFVPLKTILPAAADVPLISTVPPQAKKESWSQLILNEVTKVEIGDESNNGNWENIFMQIIDRQHMVLFNDLLELITQHVNHIKTQKEQQKRVYDFEPLHNCIVKYDNIYVRAKVYAVFGSNVKERLYRFFLCDYACFTNAKSSDLYKDVFYETTDEIVQFTPYQGVHCTLAGIQWDRFTKRYPVTKEYLYACAMEERNNEEKKTLCLCNLPIRSYKILLFECEKDGEYTTAAAFNKTLLDLGITMADETTKHYLDYKLHIQNPANDKDHNGIAVEEVNRESSSEDKVLTVEELMKFVQSCQELDELDELEETNNIPKGIESQQTEIKNIKDQVLEDKKMVDNRQKLCLLEKEKRNDDEINNDCIIDSGNKSFSSITSSNDILDGVQPMPPLKLLNKRPLTTWYETDFLIFISINAPDINDYFLQVEQTQIIFATKIQDEDYVLNLNLLGSVNPKSVSHEIRGLNVVIRLVKNVYVKWPRLLQESTKYTWLKYNYSCFDSSELECVAPQQRLQAFLENTQVINEANLGEEFDSEDSERDKFETYNAIENNDDCYDPFN